LKDEREDKTSNETEAEPRPITEADIADFDIDLTRLVEELEGTELVGQGRR
jgi:hypothetical protein